MNFVKSILTLAAMTLIIVGVSGSTCIYNAPACSTIMDQGACIAPVCAWTAAGACIAASTATCGAQADLTGAAAGDCSVAATDSPTCLGVKVKNGPTDAGSSVCAFTASTPTCVPDINAEGTVCPTLANTCTVNATNEATACAAFSSIGTCNANNPFCVWNATTSACDAVSPGGCTVNLTNEAAACTNIFDADRCVQTNGDFCIWDNTANAGAGGCAPRSTSAPSSGRDFDACAAGTTAALCDGVQVYGTKVCTSSSSQIGLDTAACGAANATIGDCQAKVVGSTQVCTFTASTCATGSNANFCTNTSPTQCDPKSSAQPGTGADVTACAAGSANIGACSAITVAGEPACQFFANTCAPAASGTVGTACAGITSVIFCGASTSADFCQIN